GLGDVWYDEMLAIANSPDPLPGSYYENVPGESEQLLEMMHSLLYDRREVFSVNLPNDGAAPYLPKDAVLECNAAAIGSSFKALRADDLPPALVAKLCSKISAVEITVEAAVEGSRDKMIEAMIADGSVGTTDAAAKLTDDLLAAHAEHLPQFAK
ncbi:MAG: hypothetical protein H6895_02805, partial [Defluviimonas sp.]|nr:hypothetical protein [Defluviimonas sp.]